MNQNTRPLTDLYNLTLQQKKDKSTKLMCSIHNLCFEIVQEFIDSECEKLKQEDRYEITVAITAKISALIIKDKLTFKARKLRQFFTRLIRVELGKFFEENRLESEEIKWKNPSQIDEGMIRSSISEVFDYLESEKIPLFYLYCESMDDDILIYLKDKFVILFRICWNIFNESRELIGTVDETDLKFDDLTNLFYLTELIKVDPKLCLLPIIIGKDNFVRLVSMFRGSNLTFPNLQDLRRMKNSSMDFQRKVKSKSLRSTDIKFINDVISMKLCPQTGLENLDTRDICGLMILAYYHSLFSKHNKIDAFIENINISNDQTKLELYKVKLAEFSEKTALLKSMKNIFINSTKLGALNGFTLRALKQKEKSNGRVN